MFDSEKFVCTRLPHSYYPLRLIFGGPHVCLFILSQPGFQICCILFFLATCRLSLFSHALLQKLLIFLAFLSMTAPAPFVTLLRPSRAIVAMATDDMCLPLCGVLIRCVSL